MLIYQIINELLQLKMKEQNMKSIISNYIKLRQIGNYKRIIMNIHLIFKQTHENYNDLYG